MMKHRVQCALAPDRARTAIDEAYEGYRQRFARFRPELRWLDSSRAAFSFVVKGMSVRGQLSLAPHAVDIEADTPLALRLFTHAAVKIIDAEVRRVLERGGAMEPPRP